MHYLDKPCGVEPSKMRIGPETGQLSEMEHSQTTIAANPPDDALAAGPPSGFPSLLTVRQFATFLNVSQSWVRRHESELPAVRTGRLLRFDSELLFLHQRATMSSGKSLKPERRSMLNRYQRGSVFKRGKRQKVWYGMFREDFQTAEGIKRRQCLVRLGTVVELPTKHAARGKLSELLGSSATIKMEMTYQELVERWRMVERPTQKSTTYNHYNNALRLYVLPAFGERTIASINREDIQRLLTNKAVAYSRSVLHSIKVACSVTLGWAVDCGWLAKNPCTRIKLPLRTGGRNVVRTALSAVQINALAEKLQEPYATLALFVAATGLRIGEAIAVKWSDFDDNVLSVTRRICEGQVDTVKSARSARRLPISIKLFERLRVLGEGHEWVFRSEAGTPVNPGNALKRYIHPAAREIGIALGGWHDFRHSLSTKLRRSGVHPKIVSDILGHKKVNLPMDVYDRTDLEDLTAPLAQVADELLSSVIKSEASASGDN